MKRLTVLLAVFAAWTLAGAQTAQLQWMTDLPAAQARAKAENKLVMLDFTGSDWCPWCIKLNQEVFSQPEFAGYAAKNLVLVEVDFPRKKPQTDGEKETNKALKEKYKVKGYPTVIVVDSDGKPVGELGYEEGGAKPFVDKLRKLSAPKGVAEGSRG